MRTPVVAGCGAITRIGKQTRIGRQTKVAVGPYPRTDRVWLTVQHAATAITLVLAPGEADAICEALAVTAPAAYLAEPDRPL